MKRIILFVLIIIGFQICGGDNAISQWSSFDSATHALLAQGIHQVHIEEYESAIETFEKLIDLYPQNPVGYFCTAAVYQIIMRNYRINLFEAQFDSLISFGIQIGENAIRKDREDALSHFYLGGAYGYMGLHKLRKRDWFGAFNDGRKGVSNLHRAVEIEPRLYDAYLGLGIYHYWRSVKVKILRFLPFFRNDRQKGIDEIWSAISKGRYTNIEGKYAMIEIYYNEKNYPMALSLNQELYELFPTNPACLYMRSRIFERQEKWEEAKNTSQQLLEHLLASEHRSIGYEVECHYRIANCLYKLGDLEQALVHVKKAIDLKGKREASKEIEGPLENFEEISKKAVQLYNEIIKQDSYIPCRENY